MLVTIGSVASLLVGVAFLISGHGLQLTLIPLRAAAEARVIDTTGMSIDAAVAAAVAEVERALRRA